MPVATRPPPIPPSVPKDVADYLRRLSFWAAQQLDTKVGKDEPQQQVMLYPSNEKIPSTVWGIIVDDTGAVAVQRVPLGGGNP